jgi:hypothetical protein
MGKTYAVELKSSILRGRRVYAAGDVIELPEALARDLCKAGGALPSGPIASLALAGAVPPAKVKAEPVETNSGGRWIRIVKGEFFDYPRTYTAQDGPVRVRSAVPYRCLVEAQPEPPARGCRTVVELIGLDPQEHRREVARLKSEATLQPTFGINRFGCSVALP